MSRELLRQLPALDKWLASEQGARLCAEYSHTEVAGVMRAHLARLRTELGNGRTALPALASEQYTALLRADLLARRTGSLRPVINATGIVIHTNLGRAPLATEAVAAMCGVAQGYSNLEYSLETGTRGSRNAHAEQLLCELTGAEAALVVNNCAAAVLLALRAFAHPGEVVVSRGELIEIGGSFRMPDVIAESGARMIEVGTTNKTTLRDYADAVGPDTRALLTSHPSNYRIVGFTARAEPRDLAKLARDKGLAFIHDLGSGTLVDLAELGAAREPTVADCIASGPDIVTFSGDKMLGGPQAGIIVGRRERIDALKRHPMARAQRIDKLSLAALTATLRLYRPPHDPRERVPVLRMLTASPTAIGERAAGVVAALAGTAGLSASVVDDVSYAGGGTLPMSELATQVVAVESAAISANEIARRLRAADTPVVARIWKDAVLLDLRTVPDEQTAALVAALRQAVP